MNEATDYLLAAYHYLEQHEPERALALLDGVARPDLEDENFWFLYGQAFYDLARYREAADMAQAGLVRAPDSTMLLYLACNCQAALGDLAAAERAILAALKLMPEDAGLLCRYAILVAQAGQLEKASRLLAEAERSAPTHPHLTQARMIISYLSGDNAHTIETGKRMLREDPDNMFGHYMLASSLIGQGRVKEADKHLRQVAGDNADDPHIAEALHELRVAQHWLLWPMRLLARFEYANIIVWFAAIATFSLLRLLDMNRAATIFSLCYIIFAIYTWVAPPLLRRWLR